MSKYLVAKKFFENKRPTGGLYDAEIEYLENSSSQYINTHIIPTDNTKFELTFKAEERSSNWSVFFGSTTSNNSPDSVLFRFYDYNDEFNVWFGQADYTSPTFDCIYNEKCTITLEYGKCTLNTEEYEIESEPLYEPYEIYLFGGNYPNDGSHTWRPQYFKCYGFKVYEANTLIMDLIPVRKGNIGYMYDKVSGQLFENQGSGNFILGQDTAYPEPEEPEEPEETPSNKFIVGKHHSENISQSNQFSVIKKQFKTKINLQFDSQGGTSHEQKEVILGETYGELPVPTKSQNVFIGWFTDPTSGQHITKDSIVELDITKLYARWEYVQIDSDCTSYSVTTTSSYRNTGIYTASIADSSQPIYIDWGDGTVEKTNSSISQKSHTYKTNGNFTVKISNNITSFAPSYNDSTWYGTTSQNRYTFNGMLTTGSKVTSLPTYAFYYCQKMTNIDFMETCWTAVTALPNYCFYYCSGLTSIQGAKRFTSLGSYCFQYCSGLTGIQDLSEFKFTTLPNSYTFANCTNVTQWILPDEFNGTSFGSYMFANNTKLSSFVLPESLTSTGTYTFQNCSNLNNIVIPSKVQSIGNYAFYGCASLNNVKIEATNLTAINQYAFYNCSKLTDLDLPDTVKTIGNYAFYGCTSLDYAGRMANDLPYDAEIEYLESDGEQWIDTGILPASNLTFECKFLCEYKTGYGNIFGSRLGYNNNEYQLTLYSNGAIGIGSRTYRTIPKNTINTVSFDGNSTVYINNIDHTITTSEITADVGSIVLFGIRDTVNKTPGQFSDSQIYSCKFGDVRDLIPVRVGNVGYMYDKVSGQLFGNSGTGNFILGPDVKTKELPSQLTSIGSYAYQGCSNLKSLNIPENLQTIGDYAFAGCYQISSIVDKRLTAQTVSTNTFGSATGTSNTAFTGYQTRGNNILSTYFNVTGYDENAWDDPLQNPDKCGFVQQYIDPENVVSCTVTFDAGIGNVSEATRSIIKGKKIGLLPTPRCPVDTPYFGGWFTSTNGTGTKVSKEYRITSDITFYALYSTVPFTVCNIDLNNQWRASSKANPDSSRYDGPYESNSNYNIGNAYSKMYIRISGYSTFNVYIRSHAESRYDYVVAMNLDVDVTSNPSSGTSNVKAHTSGKQNSGTAIGNYTKVEYTDIPDGEHFICIVYRKDGSVNENDDRGYVLIDKQDVASTDSRSIFLVDDVGILYDEDKQLMIASERI